MSPREKLGWYVNRKRESGRGRGKDLHTKTHLFIPAERGHSRKGGGGWMVWVSARLARLPACQSVEEKKRERERSTFTEFESSFPPFAPCGCTAAEGGGHLGSGGSWGWGRERKDSLKFHHPASASAALPPTHDRPTDPRPAFSWDCQTAPTPSFKTG